MSFLPRPVVVLVLFAGAGATLKVADHLGEEDQSLQAYIAAIFSGALLGVLMHLGVEESSYVLGIILGVALGGKVNRPNLLAGLLTVAISSLVLGLVMPDPWLGAVVAVLSFVDEVGHDRFANRSGLAGLLFRYRVGLKLGTVLLVVGSLVSVTTALGFLCFDLSYDLLSRFVG